MQCSSLRFSTCSRARNSHRVHEEEEDADEDNCDKNGAYFLALFFFRGHPLLVHVDPDADSPSAATYDIMHELLRVHPSLNEKYTPIFLEALLDSLPE